MAISRSRKIAKRIGKAVAADNITSTGALASSTDSAGTLILVGIDGVIREHPRRVTSNITVDSAHNAMAAGPLTIDSGFSITINDSATLVIV
jgi:hypothetical protein